MRVLLVLALAACRFEAPVAGDDSGLDASSIDAPVEPIDATPLGDWGTPVPVTELNTASHEDDPTLTGDLLEIYFASDRSLLATGEDIHVATRASIGDPFGAPTRVDELSSIAFDSNVDITADGHLITFTSTRAGGADLYFSTRAGRSQPWGNPALVQGVNSGQGEFGMVMTADLLEAVLCSDRGNNEALFRSRRDTTLEPFSNPVKLTDVETGELECDAMLPAPMTMYFTRGTNPGDLDIFLATSSDGVTFDQVTVQATLNTASRDGDPWVSADQRTLFLASNRANAINTDDIFMSTR